MSASIIAEPALEVLNARRQVARSISLIEQQRSICEKLEATMGVSENLRLISREIRSPPKPTLRETLLSLPRNGAWTSGTGWREPAIRELIGKNSPFIEHDVMPAGCDGPLWVRLTEIGLKARDCERPFFPLLRAPEDC
jgi:hypothetical protein